jgi:hypothetical protein
MKGKRFSFGRFKKGLTYLYKSPLYTRRYFELKNDEKLASSNSYIQKNHAPRLFNLDLHIGVIADIEQGLKESNVDLTRWSISMHNHLVQDRLPVSDPVRYINARKWHLLDESVISKFQKRYRNFLTSFDGFVCTYSPAFAELYKGLNKPILIITATRYEAPYSDRQADWDRLNNYLYTEVKNSKIHMYANNKGDADYLEYFTRIRPEIVPSLCEKDKISHKSNGQKVIIARDQNLINLIETSTNNIYKSIHALGNPYNWQDVKNCEEVLVFPQNISTMTLFELATAGVPVAIPSRRWILELLDNGFYLLNELSFHQVLGLDTTSMSSNNPANYNSPTFLNWWLDRSDFFNETLMPNIRIVDSVSDLVNGTIIMSQDLYEATSKRNKTITLLRKGMIEKFKASL